MVVESEQKFQFSQFMESEALPALDDRSISIDELPIKDQEGSNLLVTTGLIALIAGIGVFLASNIDIGLSGMKSLLIAAGFVGLGIGLGKTIVKLLKPRGISLPAIKVKRKAELRNSPSVSSSPLGTFRTKSSGFSKSSTDKVIMGVCGGIAESSGISSTLIRAIFIAAFAMTSGFAAVIYFGLGIIMRNNSDTIIHKR